jgi:hypothetical protein
MELNDDASFQLKVPRGMIAQAELRALKSQAGGFKLAHNLITQDIIDSATQRFALTVANHVTIDTLTLRRTCDRRKTMFSM